MRSALLHGPRRFASLSAEEVRGLWARDFGKAAHAGIEEWNQALEVECPASPGREAWLDALAVEWAVGVWLGKLLQKPPEALAGRRLPDCGSAPDCATLAASQGAATLVLLDSAEPAVAILLAWKGSAPEGSLTLPDCPGIAFHLIPSRPGLKIQGDSWQLGARLAARFIESPDSEAACRLALCWAATGRIDGRLIGRVEIGGKLRHPALRTRSILLPAESYDEIATAGALLRQNVVNIHPVQDVESALGHIVDARPASADADSVQIDRPDVLHVLVGGAWQAAFAPIALCRARRVVLWHSDDAISTNRAEAIRDALSAGLAATFETDSAPTLRHLSSSDLGSAWDELNIALSEDLEGGRRVAFNITSGNRIMGMAPLPFAQRHRNLTLLYRDVDADAFALTYLRFDGIRPVQGTLRLPAAEKRNPTIRWTALFSKGPSPKNISGEQIIAALEKNPESGESDRLESGMTSSPSTPPMPFLIGNSFPLSLVRGPVAIEPRPLEELRESLAGRPWKSFWGHANTLAAIRQHIGRDLTPATERPALKLDDLGLPMLDGQSFCECWVVSPEYQPGYRPQIGEEVPAESILSWQALRMTWQTADPAHTHSNQPQPGATKPALLPTT